MTGLTSINAILISVSESRTLTETGLIVLSRCFLKVLERHAADRMSSHVHEELRALGVDVQSFMVFTTYYGASNMMRTSQLLWSSHTQYCMAHTLHLLRLASIKSRCLLNYLIAVRMQCLSSMRKAKLLRMSAPSRMIMQS